MAARTGIPGIAAIARREPAAVGEWRSRLSATDGVSRLHAAPVFRAMDGLKRYANERGIQIIGDIPIFVAYDSADVWANPRALLRSTTKAMQSPWSRACRRITSAPPGSCGATRSIAGMCWPGQGYGWWIERFRTTLTLVDIARLDHFRGFAAYWEVPAGEETAINGRWVPGPGAALFEAVRDALGGLPIIAEDLGLITPDVEAAARRSGLPGHEGAPVRVRRRPRHIYLPHNYQPHCVVYTGTHDNDTTLGWWQTLDDKARSQVQHYLGVHGNDIAWDFIACALVRWPIRRSCRCRMCSAWAPRRASTCPVGPEGTGAGAYSRISSPTQLRTALAQLTSTYGRERLDVEEHRDMI